jgi:hypothetical protein
MLANFSPTEKLSLVNLPDSGKNPSPQRKFPARLEYDKPGTKYGEIALLSARSTSCELTQDADRLIKIAAKIAANEKQHTTQGYLI